LNYTLTSDFAIAADMNPGPPGVVAVAPNSTRAQMAQANTRNHNGDGQNVLYADGHVEFQNTPFCGMLRGRTPATGYRDNVYTHGAGFAGAPGVGVMGAAADPLDSVLLPWSPDAPSYYGALVGAAGGGRATWAFVAAGAAVMLGVVVMIVVLVRASTRPPGATPPPLP
jgi:prepilin-type processing-associated H-X9-DG protein